MKTSLDYLNSLPIKDTKNFKKNILKTLPKGVNQVCLSSCGIERVGTGSYNYDLHLTINDVMMVLKTFTNCAPDYVYYENLELGTWLFENWIKNTALFIIDDNYDDIVEVIKED